MATSRTFRMQVGPRFSISRAHLMLSKIRLKRRHFQQKCADDASLRLSLAIIDDNFEEQSIFDSDHMKSFTTSWNCSKQIIKGNLYDIISKNIECHQQTDLLIKIGNVVFRCHTFLLNCYTKYFSHYNHQQLQQQQQQQQQQQNVVEFKDTKLAEISFMKFYNWMLKDEIAIITQKDLVHLLVAGEVLNVEELRVQCWSVLNNSSIYTENIAYELYNDAKRFGVLSVQQLMVTRIWKFFLMLLATEDYRKMESAEVCQWLRSNTIGVNSEMEVFYGAILWVNSKWHERKGKPLREVMSCVRYGLLPPWFLVSLHTTRHGCDVDRVVKDSKVAKLIADGLSLTTAMLIYSKDSNEFKEILCRGNFRVPTQRKWIVDRTCPYHYYEQGSKKHEHITYEKFIDYLQYLCSSNQNHWRCLVSAADNHWNFVFKLKPSTMMLDLK